MDALTRQSCFLDGCCCTMPPYKREEADEETPFVPSWRQLTIAEKKGGDALRQPLVENMRMPARA